MARPRKIKVDQPNNESTNDNKTKTKTKTKTEGETEATIETEIGENENENKSANESERKCVKKIREKNNNEINSTQNKEIIQQDKQEKKNEKNEKEGKDKKRKKKINFTCSTYNINNDDNDNSGMCSSDNENIIMHLNFKPDTEKHDELFAYDIYLDRDDSKNEIHKQSHPIPFTNDEGFSYETLKNNKVFSDQYEIYNNAFLEKSLSDENNDMKQENKVVRLLKDFCDTNKNKEWPLSTNISCYWCCHRFYNEPFGIPLKYTQEDNKFHVFGCFCSLECALAYNLDERLEIDEMWERSNLINFLSRKLNYNKQGFVKPAPPRLSLKIFGGYLTIEEFRNIHSKDKIVNINFPPMMTVTQQIEEINESDINSDYKYIPINTDRINKYKEKIRLKRSKPVHDTRNTLDNAINIKITTKKSIPE